MVPCSVLTATDDAAVSCNSHKNPYPILVQFVVTQQSRGLSQEANACSGGLEILYLPSSPKVHGQPATTSHPKPDESSPRPSELFP
jgi:hypothetical protein